ncbi:MAG: Hsp70 family protein [Myxococcales bacterium]|nr:Hsp70 family protein [Myxococcales bacterium]
MGLFIGIDLGTTNSVAGVATPEGVRLAADNKGKRIHASVVSLSTGGEHILGNSAKVRKATDPGRTIYSAKRLIGQNVRAPLVQLAMASLPYPVEEGNNQQPIIVVGGRRMTVPEVSAMVLTHLRQLCEAQFEDEIAGAVITVPANFSDSQRQGTKEAGRLAGLEVMRLVNEPTAAALAYGYGRSMDQRVAVFDFGGGTFDFSLLKIDSDIFEVLGTDGEFFLGGDDIDQMVAEFLAAEMNRSLGIDPRPIPTAMNRLHIAAEQIKQYLTSNTLAGGTIDGIVVNDSGKSVSVEFELSRDKFDTMVEGYVDRTIDVCRNVLTTTGLEVGDIDDVIMVGGSTRIPLVHQRLSEFFSQEPASRINPDEVVAHGAAIQAAMLAGSVHESPRSGSGEVTDELAEDGDVAAKGNVAAKSEVAADDDLAENPMPIDLGVKEDGKPSQGGGALLLDVTPATLRIATAGGYSEPFLERNSPIPVERTKLFTTAQANQTRVVIECYRGSARKQEENELLGSLELNDIPPGDRGEAKIEVTFRVDPDSILHVRAKDLQTENEVEAKLNVIGAPVPGDQCSTMNLPEGLTEKQAAKFRQKQEKEQQRLDKKAEKGRAKAEKQRQKQAKRAETADED